MFSLNQDHPLFILVQLIVSIIGVITPVIVYLNKKIITPLDQLNENVKEIEKLHSERSITLIEHSSSLKKLEKIVLENSESHIKSSEILMELKPNGGGSIKDKINYMYKSIEDLNYSIEYVKNLTQTQLNLVPYAIWKSNSKGENIFVNEYYLELLEVDSTKTLEWRWTSLIHKDDFNDYLKAWEDTLKFKTDKDVFVRIVTFKTKKIINCKSSWRVTLDSKGNISYIIGKLKEMPETISN